jgi:Mor family transcriptional regulator
MPLISKPELKKLQKSLRTDKAIGQKFGITHQAVQQIRKLYAIPRIPRKRVQLIPMDKLVELQHELNTDKAIADKIGYEPHQVCRMRHFYGIPTVYRLGKTTRNNRIIALYHNGMSGPAIAKEYGLCKYSVYRIIYAAGAGRRKRKCLPKNCRRAPKLYHLMGTF